MKLLACLAQVLGGGGGFGGGGRGGRGGGGGGGNRNSVFYQTIIKPQKALQASASSQLSELAGEFSVSITPYPGKSLAEMEQLVNEAFAEFEKRGVTDDDIEKFKNEFESRADQWTVKCIGKSKPVGSIPDFHRQSKHDQKIIG